MKEKHSNRAQKSAETKKRIEDAGRFLFRKYGYDNVSVDMITKSANVSIGSFYHYYHSKKELWDIISAVINDCFVFPDNINYIEDDCIISVKEYFYQYGVAMSEKFDETYLREIFLQTEGNRTIVNVNRDMYTLLERMIQGFQQAGRIITDISPKQIAVNIVICVRGTVYDWINNHYSYNLIEKMNEIIEVVVSYYLLRL